MKPLIMENRLAVSNDNGVELTLPELTVTVSEIQTARAHCLQLPPFIYWVIVLVVVTLTVSHRSRHIFCCFNQQKKILKLPDCQTTTNNRYFKSLAVTVSTVEPREAGPCPTVGDCLLQEHTQQFSC